jgi:hypothetical protein
MPFFQLNGLTCVGTHFAMCYAILPNETTDTFHWLFRQIKDLQIQESIPDPSVSISDFDDQYKTAVKQAWPETKQQLCIWHIMKNVRLKAYEKWRGPKPTLSKKPVLSAEQLLSARNDLVRTHMSRETAMGLTFEPEFPPELSEEEKKRAYDRWVHSLPLVDHDPNGVLTLWTLVAHATTVREMEKHWDDLSAEFADQPAVVKYFRDTYYRVREQWALSYIQDYRNYGIRSSQLSESAHNEIKVSILIP